MIENSLHAFEQGHSDMDRRNAFALQVVEKLMAADRFSQWLGLTIIEVRYGFSKIQMTVRDEMANGFGIAHGGIAFSLADSAFAFACNSAGKITVALDVSISFTRAIKAGNVLIAEARELNQTNRTGLYIIEVKNQDGELAALFKGTCYKTDKDV